MNRTPDWYRYNRLASSITGLVIGAIALTGCTDPDVTGTVYSVDKTASQVAVQVCGFSGQQADCYASTRVLHIPEGAVLTTGQTVSIQDNTLVPPTR